MRLHAVGYLLVLGALGHGQTIALPAFGVVSVKPQKWTGNGGFYVMVRGNTLAGEHADLASLVEFAYNMQDFQLSGGPAWAVHGIFDDSELFQVLAKPPAGRTPTMDQFRQLLQLMLADRFQLQIHHVTK